MDPHVPLWCKSNFSFLEGASHPEELIERAHELGLPALALTDRDGVFGLPRAHVRAEELGVKLILGAQVTLLDGGLLVLLAQDRTGYGNLCQLLSKGRLRCEKGSSAVTQDEVCAHAEGMLTLWGAKSLMRPQDGYLLGLGALTLVHQCFDLLRQHHALDLDLARLPADDPATYDMFCKGDTVGVFQIESRWHPSGRISAARTADATTRPTLVLDPSLWSNASQLKSPQPSPWGSDGAARGEREHWPSSPTSARERSSILGVAAPCCAGRGRSLRRLGVDRDRADTEPIAHPPIVTAEPADVTSPIRFAAGSTASHCK